MLKWKSLAQRAATSLQTQAQRGQVCNVQSRGTFVISDSVTAFIYTFICVIPTIHIMTESTAIRRAAAEGEYHTAATYSNDHIHGKNVMSRVLR